MNKKNNLLRAVLVLFVFSIAVNWYTYKLYRIEKQIGELLEKSELFSRAVYEARDAIYRGEFRLYEKEMPNTVRTPPDQMLTDFATYIDMHSFKVSGDQLENWDDYYKIYNNLIRYFVANPSSAEWQTYLAVKAAKARGEWIEEAREEIEKKPKPEFRRMTTEEAFGPAPVEKKN